MLKSLQPLLCLFLAALAGSLSVLRAGVPVTDELSIRINRTLGSHQPDPSWVTPEIRQEVIDRLLKSKEGPGDPNFENIALVLVEHEETIKELAEGLGNGSWNQTLSQYGTPAVIPYVIGLLDEGSTEDIVFESGTCVVVYPPFRQQAAEVIVSVIEREKAFPAETREWAKEMRWLIAFPPRQDRRNLIKEWWRQNRTAVLEKRYADAVWLPPPYKGRASALTMEELTDRKARLEEHRSSRKNPTSSGDKATRPNPGTSNPWPTRIAIALATVVLLAAARFLKLV